MKDLKPFIGKYRVEKTLRFELHPDSETETKDRLEKNETLANDKQRAKDYVIVKDLIDRYHKVCIRESLAKFKLDKEEDKLDWPTLKNDLDTYHSHKGKESLSALRKCQDDLRAKISKKFESFPHYHELTASTPSKLIKKILPNCIENDSLPEFRDIDKKEYSRALLSFKTFAVYFKDYQESRKNLYTKKDISSSVAHRIVHDNFPKFVANIKVFENINQFYPEVIKDCTSELGKYLNGKTLHEIFSDVSYYNNVLTQDGIELYNAIIGGVSEKEGDKKKGINELVNSHLQKNHQGKDKRNALTMVPLFKQILSDKNTFSFVYERINDETELIRAIGDFHSHISSFPLNGNSVNIIEELQRILKRLDDFDPNGIFVEGKKLNSISKKLFDNWSKLRYSIASHLEEDGWDTDMIDKFLKRDAFSVTELCIDDGHSMTKCFDDLDNIAKDIDEYWKQFENRNEKNTKKQKYKNNKEGTDLIRHLLDGYKEFLSSLLYFEC